MADTFVNGRAGIPPGDLKETYVDHFGPASYTQLAYGSSLPVTGGELVTATQFGLVSIVGIFMLGDGSDGTSLYSVKRVLIPNQNNKSGKDVPSARLQWNVTSTPGTNTTAEASNAANLSTISVRLLVIGY